MFLDDLPLAYLKPESKALFRQQTEHFIVNETLSFTPTGTGDHLYLRIQKRNTNTDWLARELARKTGLHPRDVGYAGRKDRFAVTSQWFSLHLPASRHIDLAIFQDPDYQLLDHTRHNKKLRKGEISANQFELQLTEFDGDYSAFKERVALISAQGFPNYFGPQRFGIKGANVDKAKAMLAGELRVTDRNKRSIYLSAARSYLFNLVLARRVKDNIWQSAINGDQYWDVQSRTLSEVLPINAQLKDKIEKGLITVTGPMPGDGKSTVQGDSLALEQDVLAKEQSLYQGIANSRVQWQRRPLNVRPQNMSCVENELGVILTFALGKGSFATSLLRELFVSPDSG